MIPTLLPDVLISLNQRRWACVLDPTLAISDCGLLLVKQLGELLELWVVREFWHILDNRQFYCQDFEHLSSQSDEFSLEVIRAMKEWDRLRHTTDRATWNIHFLADVLGESYVPSGTDPDIIWRWESLAGSLDNRLEQPLSQVSSISLAYRDLAALAAARPARILTYRLPKEAAVNQPPRLCETLEKWGISCRELSVNDPIVSLEREQFCQVLIHAGLAKLLWAGMDLIVCHLMVPAAATLSTLNDWTEDLDFSEMDASSRELDLWEGSQSFWYSLK